MRIIGKFCLKLFAGRVPLRERPVNIAEFVMNSRLLRSHVSGFLVLEERAVVVFHALHNLAGHFMDKLGIGIDGVHLRERLL